MRLEAVDPRAQAGDDRDEVREYRRVFTLAESGAPLGIAELAVLFRVGVSRAHKLDRAHAFDKFLLREPVGPKRFSGTLVIRNLLGEPLYVPTFGAKRGVR